MAYRLTKIWVWLHLASLIGLALQPSSPAVLFGRYSRNALLVMAALALTLPVMWWGARRVSALMAQHRLPQVIAWVLWFVIGAGLFILWWLPVASAPPYNVIRLYLTTVAITIALWTLEGDAQEARTPTPLSLLLSLLVIVTTGVLFSVILWFPGVRFIDEAYMASLSWNFAHTGRIEPLIYQLVDTESYALMYMGLGGWFRVFGFGLWTARAFIYTVGLITLGVTWITARRLYGGPAAWIAVMLGAFALVPINLLRQDISVALYLAIAILVYVHATRTERHWLHIIVGFFVAFATDGHPNAYRFSFAFGAAYLLEWALLWRDTKQFTLYRPLVYLVIGGVMGVGAYIGLYTTLGDDLLSLASSPFLDATKAPPLVFLDQIVEPLRTVPLVIGAAMIGLVIGLRRNDPIVRLVAVVLLVNMTIIATLYGYYRAYYVAQSIGLFVLLAAVMLTHLNNRPRVALGIAVLFIAANGGYLLNRIAVDDLREGFNDTLRVSMDLREILPEGSTLVATDPMYFELVDHVTFHEYATAGWAAGKFDVSETTIWEQAAPDAVVIVHDNPERPSDSLIAYMATQGMVPTTCWESSRIGRVDLFQLPQALDPRQTGRPRGQFDAMIDDLVCKELS